MRVCAEGFKEEILQVWGEGVGRRSILPTLLYPSKHHPARQPAGVRAGAVTTWHRWTSTYQWAASFSTLFHPSEDPPTKQLSA